MSFPSDLTWKCHVCGDERPDAVIGVHTESELLGGCGLSIPVRANVRYCKDRLKCCERAPVLALSWLCSGDSDG